MRGVMNLFVLMIIGIILADMLIHVQGTNALLGNTASIWQTGVNGMLGQTTGTQTPTTAGG